MAELSPEDAQAFREDLGLAEPGLDRVIRSTYELLGLVSFLTAGEDECRAWTIKRGTRAQLAAGTIHSDIERGFIRAQVVAFSDLVAAGSLAACREKGTLRLEGPRLPRPGRGRDRVQVQRLRRPAWRTVPPAAARWRSRARTASIAERRSGAPLAPPRPRPARSRPLPSQGPAFSSWSISREASPGRSPRRSRSRVTRPGCSPGAAGSTSCAPRRPRRPRPRPSVCARSARSRSWCPRPRCAPRPCRASRASARATACGCAARRDPRPSRRETCSWS